MSHRCRAMKRFWAITAFTLLSSAGGLSHAENTADCAPSYADTQAVVDTGLPVVQIWTNLAAPIVDRENYVKACMRISDGSVQPYRKGLFHGTIKIRGRGHSSWDMPKKGYRVKLDTASPVLDMPSHKDWVLLANYADKTLMRNAVGMELSRRAGLPWTPRLRFVEVYLNDEFLGNYQLGEKIEVAPERVAITEMSTSDISTPNLTGGYLLEADFFERIDPTTDRFFTTIEGINFVMKSPSDSDVTNEQAKYIHQYTQDVETAILSRNYDRDTGYPSLIDVDSLINWYLVQEVMKNVDSVFASSVYVVKDRNSKMAMGPVWDFDFAAGNLDYEPLAMYPEGWYVSAQSAWFDYLMQDKAFKKQVKKRWDKIKKQMKKIDGYVAELNSQLKYSQAENFKRWPILDTYVWPNAVVLGSHEAEVAYLTKWLKARVKWIDKNIGK